MKRHILLLLLVTLCFQCKRTTKNKFPKNHVKSTIKYAKGFDIVTENGVKKLVIKKVFQNANEQFLYTLTTATNLAKYEIKVPVKRMVVTSTTYIPMIELLEQQNTLVGFPYTQYISSVKTRNRIKKGKIVELGLEHDMNIEKLLDLQPELVVGFSLHATNRVYENLKKAGIPVIFNGDWLEETPLGRAEWIKFFGALYGKEKEADRIFTSIEQEYHNAKKLAKNNQQSPTILSGVMFKNVWDVPAGESFMATFFNDANLNYFWKETKGIGSLPLNFENVLEKAKHADYWLNCGLHETKEQLVAANPHYKEFDAYTNNRIYTIARKKGETGGLLYFEQSPTRPDLVLKDLIKITNPKLFPKYELTFFSKVN